MPKGKQTILTKMYYVCKFKALFSLVAKELVVKMMTLQNLIFLSLY